MKWIYLLFVLAACAHNPVGDTPDFPQARSHDDQLWLTPHSEAVAPSMKDFAEQPADIVIDAALCPKRLNREIDISKVDFDGEDGESVAKTILRLTPKQGVARFTLKTSTTYEAGSEYRICPATKQREINPEACFAGLEFEPLKHGRNATKRYDIRYYGRDCALEREPAHVH